MTTGHGSTAKLTQRLAVLQVICDREDQPPANEISCRAPAIALTLEAVAFYGKPPF